MSNDAYNLEVKIASDTYSDPAIIDAVKREEGSAPAWLNVNLSRSGESVRAFCIGLLVAKWKLGGEEGMGDYEIAKVSAKIEDTCWIDTLGNAFDAPRATWLQELEIWLPSAIFLVGIRGRSGAKSSVRFFGNILKPRQLRIISEEGLLPSDGGHELCDRRVFIEIAEKMEEEGPWNEKWIYVPQKIKKKTITISTKGVLMTIKGDDPQVVKEILKKVSEALGEEIVLKEWIEDGDSS